MRDIDNSVGKGLPFWATLHTSGYAMKSMWRSSVLDHTRMWTSEIAVEFHVSLAPISEPRRIFFAIQTALSVVRAR